MKRIHRILAALLCLCLVGLSGCTPSTGDGEGQTESGQGPDSTVALGRYTEQKLEYPDVNSVIQQLGDKSFRMLGTDSSGNYTALASEDAGDSWQPIDYPWLDELYPYMVSGFVFTEDGGVYLLYGMNEEDLSYKDLDAYPGEIDRSQMETLYFAYGDMQGLTQIEHRLGAYSPYIQLLPSDNGAVVYDDYQFAGIIDVETGTIQELVQIPEYRYDGVYRMYDNIFAISEGDTLHRYDLETGEKLPSLTYDTAMVSRYNNSDPRDKRIAIDSAHEAIYYCDPSGIYRMLADGVLTEFLVDGNQASFGLPSLSTGGLFCHEDGSFTVLCYDSSYRLSLYRYTFDPDIPVEPTRQIQVYSLQDSLTLKEAIVGYQRENPDVHIQYVIGMTAEDGVTAADALRSLSTQMLAGSGPDVLLLDGVPIDSYIEKETLLDLQDLVAPKVASGELAENAAAAFRQQDGAYYAVPARFIPMVITGDNLEDVHDVASLLTWMQQRGGQPIRLPADQVMERMYDAHAYRWVDENGGWNADAFARDLADMGAVSELIQEYEIEDNGVTQRQRGDITFISGFNFLYGGNRFTMGRMHSLMVAGHNGLEQMLAANGNGSIKAFADADGGVFVPACILGVNAGSPETELAADFVAYCLDFEVQSTVLQDGLPVQMAALIKSADIPEGDSIVYRGRTVLAYRTDLETGALLEEVELPWEWSSEAFQAQLVELATSLQQVAPNNAVLKQIVIDETAGYFTGEQSLEDTLQAVNQKVELYLLEKA